MTSRYPQVRPALESLEAVGDVTGNGSLLLRYVACFWCPKVLPSQPRCRGGTPGRADVQVVSVHFVVLLQPLSDTEPGDLRFCSGQGYN